MDCDNFTTRQEWIVTTSVQDRNGLQQLQYKTGMDCNNFSTRLSGMDHNNFSTRWRRMDCKNVSVRQEWM